MVVAVVLGLLASTLGGACRGRPPSPAAVKRAFYYWRTTFALDGAEEATLRRHHVERLYVRVFDVVPDKATGAPAPVARCAFRRAPPAGLEIVPVVFLANSVFEQAGAPPGGEALALKVWRLARDMASGAGFELRELQVDCDWTLATREAFFAFCRALEGATHATGVRLSATIRLHQAKYPERTGVPPVDRGMLMFYNMGSLEPAPARSSIFNAEDAGRYVASLDRYPLPLDAALPVFSWAIHGRAGRVVGLVEKMDAAALDAEPVLRRAEGQLYVATQSIFFRGGYLQKGDTLALETMTPPLARQAAALLGQHLHPRAAISVALFDLDERNLRDYGPSDLESIYSAVQP